MGDGGDADPMPRARGFRLEMCGIELGFRECKQPFCGIDNVRWQNTQEM
jgi:hypothetical protein